MSPDGPRAPDEPSAAPPSRPSRAWFAALVLALLVPGLVAAWAFDRRDTPPEAAALFLHEAQRAVPDGPGGSTWQPVPLPYRCANPAADAEATVGCTVTLRFSFRHDPTEGRLWSLYLPSFRGTVTASLNGAFLASSQWQQPTAEHYSIAPMLVPLPEPLLRAGDNVFELTVVTRGLIAGFLGPVALGPDVVLRPHYERRLFTIVTLPRLMDGWQIAMGLAMFVLWLARPREQVFLLFGGMLLFHATTSLPALLGGVVDPWFLQLANHGRIVAASLILPLAWHFVGRKPPVPLTVFLLFPAATLASYLALPPDMHGRVMGWVVIPSAVILILAGLGVLLRAAFVKRDSGAMLLCGAALVAMVLGVHDALVVHRMLAEDAPVLGRFAAPGVMATVGAVLIWRFAQAMNVLDGFSAHLKAAVVTAEDALRQSFAREQAQARAMVLEAERVRLMSDLHDGIAGQLVSILARCELEGSGSDQIVGAVRGALADLRLVIASLEDSGDDLGLMLALFRERIEPQLAAFGVTLAWRMRPLPDIAGLHPGATLNIFRILQEAAINAARHSGSPTLALEAAPSPLPTQAIRLTIRDQGHGGVVRRPGSYGLDNMGRRAEALGAELRIESDPSGTAVHLDLPTRLA